MKKLIVSTIVLRLHQINFLFAGAILIVGFFAVSNAAATIVAYDTFDTGDPVEYVNSGFGALPTIVGPNSYFSTNSLEFNNHDQVEYPIDPALREEELLSISFDVATDGAIVPGIFVGESGFKVLIDTPSVRFLQLDNNGNVIVSEWSDAQFGGGSIDELIIGSYSDGVNYHFDMKFRQLDPYNNIPDVPNGGAVFDIFMDGQLIYSGESQASWLGGIRVAQQSSIREPNNSTVYLDNFRATIVPLPPALGLFGAALASLGWIRRKRVS